MRILSLIWMAAALLSAAACNRGPARAPVIGEAFAGPMSLNLRQEISLKSPTVTTVKHAERLEILQVRRRFARVRSANGAEGWCDAEKLLSTEQMERLRAVNAIAAKLPSQGEAMVYDVVNVHTEPNRQAPSFSQLRENERVQVIGHKLAPRIPFKSTITQKISQPNKPAPVTKRTRRQTKKEAARDDGIERPPAPSAPAPPSNWMEISRRTPLVLPETPKKPEPPKAPAPGDPEPVRMEDWSLIRTGAGHAGWVLTRMLTMTIPDEVSQYAEGHRIVSWFPLGEVTTEDGTVKKHYVWMTIPRGGEEFEFDGLRVFIYSLRRKRYETAFRLRDVKGYYPSAVHPVDVTINRKPATVPGFTVVLENEEGKLERKTFAFEGYRVRLITTAPWERLADPLDVKAAEITKPYDPNAHAEEKGWWERLKEKIPGLGPKT